MNRLLCIIAAVFGTASQAKELDLWSDFVDRCLNAYTSQGLPLVEGLIEVEPARESQRSFRSRDERLLLILESTPGEGTQSCKLYGFHNSEDPAGMASFKKWRASVLATEEFKTDDIGRLFTTDVSTRLMVDARAGEDPKTGKNVTLYEVVAWD